MYQNELLTSRLSKVFVLQLAKACI